MKKIALLLMLCATFLFAESIIKNQTDIPMTGRPVMFIFDSKTCPYCEKLAKELNEVTFLNEIAKKFDIYSIPRDDHKIYKLFGKDVSTQELQMSYHVKATPNIVLFNSKAQKIFQTPGYISPMPLSKMMEFVIGIDQDKYQKSDWAKYLFDNNIGATEKPKPKSKQH